MPITLDPKKRAKKRAKKKDDLLKLKDKFSLGGLSKSDMELKLRMDKANSSPTRKKKTKKKTKKVRGY